MRKRKVKSEPSPLEALQYLESMRQLSEDKDDPTVMISLRIPGNILKTLKNKAKIENKKYQSLIIELLRIGLKK
jgi:predicted DNA binding CopG/RHH family protein